MTYVPHPVVKAVRRQRKWKIKAEFYLLIFTNTK